MTTLKNIQIRVWASFTNNNFDSFCMVQRLKNYRSISKNYRLLVFYFDKNIPDKNQYFFEIIEIYHFTELLS